MSDIVIPMIKNIQELEDYIAPSKKALFSHSLYSSLKDINALRCFMFYHVYAVWDFMNLLSYLQSNYTSTSAPWSPPKHPKIARLINEIKLEEESDIINNNVTSHFDFYIFAMKSLSINTEAIETFLGNLKTTNYKDILSNKIIPEITRPFLLETYRAIESGPAGAAASFTFGRETVIPQMFSNILENSHLTPDLDLFKTYLDRHIELDGEEHSHLSRKIVTEICKKDPELWQKATYSADTAINARIALYSNIELAIKTNHEH